MSLEASPHSLQTIVANISRVIVVATAEFHRSERLDRRHCLSLRLGTIVGSLSLSYTAGSTSSSCHREVVWEASPNVKLPHQLLVLPVEVIEDLRS